MSDPEFSIIVPAYQEAAVLAEAMGRIQAHADQLGTVEYIVIDDGSNDATWAEIQKLSDQSTNVIGLKLSRNFGKEAALNAGLKAAKGQAVITMDADLQHPPELLPEMARLWREGAMVVNTVKRNRQVETRLKAWLTRQYFGLFRSLAGIQIGNASDYKLLDREVVDCLNNLHERERFYRGLVGWIGYRQEALEFDVAPRLAGIGKWSSFKLIGLALNSIVSFSTAPMHLMTALGAIFGSVAVVLTLRTLWLWLTGTAVPGFSTVILLLILIGAILMVGLGIIGIYIAKIYEEVKQRPEFLVEDVIGPDSDKYQRDQ